MKSEKLQFLNDCDKIEYIRTVLKKEKNKLLEYNKEVQKKNAELISQ